MQKRKRVSATLSIVNVLQLALPIFGLMFVGYQLLLQRRELANQVEVQGCLLYQDLANRYADLLHRADEDPVLNGVWDPCDGERFEALTGAHQSRVWGAWHAMTNDERRCYRYIRSALEIFEQAHVVRKRGWIDDETWAKWQGWMTIWRQASYYPFVMDDSRERLLTTFVEVMEHEHKTRDETDWGAAAT